MNIKRLLAPQFHFFCLWLLFGLFQSPEIFAQEGTLSVRILDADSEQPTPARVRITDEKGSIAPLPEEAIRIMYGRNDFAEGYGYQPDSAFYVNGGFTLELPEGRYQMMVSKGFEYVSQEIEMDIRSGENTSKEIHLERWINMPAKGWYSADDHIHIRRSPRENPLILQWIAAEDIHVGALLQMGDIWTMYYAQFAFGKAGVYMEHDHMLTSGQEDPRTHEIGHTILLGQDSMVRNWQNYYSYDEVFDKIHDLDGLTGYAHQGMSFHGYRGMTMDVLRGKVDFLELLQFCVANGPLHLDHYYHFLDLGYKLTATAGSDFPWCGKSTGWDARIGNARFYTYMGNEQSFESWKKNLKAGHTFVSSGPMLELTVDEMIPGDELKTGKGDVIKIRAKAYGHEIMTPLSNLEIVAHGEVIASAGSTDQGQSPEEIVLEIELPVEEGLWVAARCEAGDLQLAHTTPVYVTIDDMGFINRHTAADYLDLSESYLQEVEEEIAERNDHRVFNAWRYKDELDKRIQETREVIEELRKSLE